MTCVVRAEGVAHYLVVAISSQSCRNRVFIRVVVIVELTSCPSSYRLRDVVTVASLQRREAAIALAVLLFLSFVLKDKIPLNLEWTSPLSAQLTVTLTDPGKIV